MTAEEALKTINMNLQVAIHDLEGLEPEYEKNQIEALKISREAIEKQIPKKPSEKYVNSVCIDWACPVCGRFHRNEFFLKFCSECGQAIDWSDSE